MERLCEVEGGTLRLDKEPGRECLPYILVTAAERPPTPNQRAETKKLQEKLLTPSQRTGITLLVIPALLQLNTNGKTIPVHNYGFSRAEPEIELPSPQPMSSLHFTEVDSTLIPTLGAKWRGSLFISSAAGGSTPVPLPR